MFKPGNFQVADRLVVLVPAMCWHCQLAASMRICTHNLQHSQASTIYQGHHNAVSDSLTVMTGSGRPGRNKLLMLLICAASGAHPPLVYHACSSPPFLLLLQVPSTCG
jgi:hypothetical protein